MNVPNILIVEDNADQRHTLRRLLEDEGYAIQATATGAEALDLARQTHFGVALVDLRLPDMSGTQVLHQLRHLDDRIQVIIHTAYGSFDSAKSSVNYGAFAYLEKPSEPDELVATVHRAANSWMRDALQRSEDRYQTLAELSPVGIFHTNSNGVYQYVNRRWCEISGLTVDEVKSKGWMSALHPADERRVIEEWYEALTEERGFASEYRLRHKNGREVWVYGQTSPETKDDAVVGYVGTMTDVTRQKLAEESLRLLNAALEQAQVAVAIVSAGETLRFVYANPAFGDMSGYLPDELVGRPLSLLYGSETEPDSVERLQDVLAAGESFQVELLGQRRDGTALGAEWRMDPVRDGRRVTHWVAMVRELPQG
jgi:PAS domain S-box-containing protein